MMLQIKMKLLSDAVFGNGISIPGGEDISILCDPYGFPLYRGGTFKGIFREELTRYLEWSLDSEAEVNEKITRMLGKSGSMMTDDSGRTVFSDFTLSEAVRAAILEETGTGQPELVTDALSHLRTFTKLNEEGMAEEGSLRICRCVNRNLIFYSQAYCFDEDVPLVKDVLKLIKWVGSMRNRGFGKVQLSVSE